MRPPAASAAFRRADLARRSWIVPTIPWGKKMMMTMIRTPKKMRCPDPTQTRKASETRM